MALTPTAPLESLCLFAECSLTLLALTNALGRLARLDLARLVCVHTREDVRVLPRGFDLGRDREPATVELPHSATARDMRRAVRDGLDRDNARAHARQRYPGEEADQISFQPVGALSEQRRER